MSLESNDGGNTVTLSEELTVVVAELHRRVDALRAAFEQHVAQPADATLVTLAAQLEAVRQERDRIQIDLDIHEREAKALGNALADFDAWLAERRDAKGVTTLTMIQARLREALGQEESEGSAHAQSR